MLLARRASLGHRLDTKTITPFFKFRTMKSDLADGSDRLGRLVGAIKAQHPILITHAALFFFP